MTSKGQVTIPKAVRAAAGLRPGQVVEVELGANGTAQVRAVDEDAERAARRARFHATLEYWTARTIPLGMSTDEYMAMIREPLP